MPVFNQQELDKYFNARDFNGAADYLESIPAADPQKQIALNNQIRNLRKQGELQAAYVGRLDEEGAQAFHFINALNGNGAIPHTQYKDKAVVPNSSNAYGDQYTFLVNNLKVNPTDANFSNQRITSLQVEIDTDFINTFANSLGVTDIKNNNLGIKYTQTKDGKHLVELPTNSNNLYKLLKATYDLDNFWSTVGEKATAYSVAGAAAGAAAGAVAASVTGGAASPAIGSWAGITGAASFIGGGVKAMLDYKSPFKIIGKGKGFTAPEEAFNSKFLKDIVDVVDEANNRYNKDKEQNDNFSLTEELYVTPYLGHGHADAYKMLSDGSISIEDYNKIVEERTNTYNNLLKQTDLTQYRVWGVDSENEDEGFVMKEFDNKTRLDIMKKLSVAIKDKRVTYSAAMKGGEVGTYITIAADKDKDGDLSNGETEQFTRIFVPGLFKSSCDEAFNADTKTLASKDAAEMKRYNYGKRLHDGTYVGHCTDLGYYCIVKDTNGNEIKQPIAENSAITLLNKENIIDKSVDGILARLGDTNNKIDVDSYANLAATVASNELFPEDSFSREDIIYQQNEIYKSILSLLKIYTANRNKTE